MNEAQSLEQVNEVKNRHEERLLGLPGVVGVAVGLSKRAEGQTQPRRHVIKVLVSSMKNLRGTAGTHPIPESLEGVPVEVEETGEFHAY